MWTRRFRPGRALASLAVAALAVLIGPTLRADETDVVGVLEAQRDGLLDVAVRGQGQDRVKMILTNRSPRRLHVVLPPGLVAAASVSQGFQSMGLGTPTDQPGRFGGIESTVPTSGAGFRSVAATPTPASVAVGSGQTVEFSVPAVCLNFGIPTPTPRDQFTLMDVSDYTSDSRAVKALRSLAVLGTSRGVAQAVAWNVFNQMSFPQIAKQAAKYLNANEVTVAARFVEALDASSQHELVDPAMFREGRMLVRISGQGNTAKHVERLREELNGLNLLGLPVQVVDQVSEETSRPSTMLIDVELSSTSEKPNQTRARVLVRHNAVLGGWARLGTADLELNGDAATLNGTRLAGVLDHELAKSFVTVTPARRSPGLTTFRVVNRLPMTVSTLVVRTGRSEGAPISVLERVEVGPGRSAIATIPAPLGLVERVELTGL